MKLHCIFFLLIPGLIAAQSAQPASKKAWQNSIVQPLRVEGDNKVPQKEDVDFSLAEASQKQPGFWLNNYTNQRNAFTNSDGFLNEAEVKQLNQMVSEAEQAIPASFELYYMQVRQHRNKAASATFLEQAALKGGLTHPLLLPEIAWIAERNNDKAARNKAIQAYDVAGQISLAQATIASMSTNIAGSRALLITNGEFDTYPLWSAASNAHVISLAMLEDKEWLMRTLRAWDPSLKVNKINNANELLRFLTENARLPVYVSLSLRPDLLKAFANSLFPIGPLAKLQKEQVDLTSQLKGFYLKPAFEQELLKISKADGYASVLANLLPGLVALYHSGNALSAQEKSKVKALIALVSSISGKKIAYE